MIDAIKSQEIDGEAIYALAESSNFEADFNSFLDVVKSEHEAISLPFGPKIKIKAAIRRLVDRGIGQTIHLEDSDKSLDVKGMISTAECFDPCAAGDAADSNVLIPTLNSSSHLVAGGTVTHLDGRETTAESNVVYHYVTVERDEPVQLILKKSEATPLGLKAAIARAEGFDFIPDSDGLKLQRSFHGPANLDASSSDDHDRWSLQVKLKGSNEFFFAVCISNQKVSQRPFSDGQKKT